jgi:hypothetical protein
LLVRNSSVVVEDSALIASDAGHGGNGAEGQEGQMEAGFGGLQAPSACPGGAGGFGGKGAAGGGGAGGISAGVVWSGDAAPSLTGTTRSLGLPGAKGLGGEPGTNDGIDGVAEDVIEMP